jgi:hypothetical protein
MRVKLIKQKELGDYYLILEGKIYHTNPLFYKRHGVSKGGKLSKQNCDEIFGVVDVEKLAEEEIPNDGYADTTLMQKGFIKGFNKAMELYQPTEIDVEIVMEKIVDETKMIGAVKGVKGSGDKITTYKSVPKIDSEGCLTLKKI